VALKKGNISEVHEVHGAIRNRSSNPTSRYGTSALVGAR